MAPKHLYSGLGNDTIGPAYYEPKPMDKTVRILTCCFLNKLALFA